MQLILRDTDSSSVTVISCEHITFGRMRNSLDQNLKVFIKDSGDFTISVVDAENVLTVLP